MPAILVHSLCYEHYEVSSFLLVVNSYLLMCVPAKLNTHKTNKHIQKLYTVHLTSTKYKCIHIIIVYIHYIENSCAHKLKQIKSYHGDFCTNILFYAYCLVKLPRLGTYILASRYLILHSIPYKAI